jgi:hypothetical protein
MPVLDSTEAQGMLTAIELLITEWRTYHKVPDDIDVEWNAQITDKSMTLTFRRSSTGHA